jgi:CRP/FNR family transcriptional regulator, anaerobic regulatory protein
MRIFDTFIEAINKIVSLPETEIQRILPLLNYKEYKKEEHLTTQGETESYIYFILEGGVRNYYLFEGEEYSFDFHLAGSFANSYMSFLLQEPSTINVQALFATKTIRLHYTDVMRLYKESFTFNTLGRIITESLYIRRTKRELSFITQSAKERYETLLSRNPELVQQIPQKYIASYLGIKAESLSRIRGVFKKKIFEGK